jgi:AraC-like DNA-binding protein
MHYRYTPPRVAVATILTPSERAHVDAAGTGSYETLHRERVAEVVTDLKARRAEAVLISVARCDDSMALALTAMVREFPRVPTVGLVSTPTPELPKLAPALGTTGVRRLVDVQRPDGWRELRRYLLSYQAADIQREALARLAVDLSGTTEECWRFFESLFLAGPGVTTIRVLCLELGILPSTLMSRFYRADLPSPKQYLATARLVRAARLLENPGFSIANVANHLDYSSPQSFCRHLRTSLGMTASGFRSRYDGGQMLDHFREVLVLPHQERLRQLRPLAASGINTGLTRLH